MYKSKKRFSITLFLCLAVIYSAFATHSRAGEITYKWVSGYTYQIKVTTYTNIGGAGLADRCENTVYFGDGTSAIVLRTNGPSALCSPAHDGVPICPTIKLNEYVTTHTFAGPGNYIITMEDPNRNGGIINIPNSVNQVFYIECLLNIPTFTSGKNDSPVLAFLPNNNGCVNNCFYYNCGAYDIDGDSLSYQLIPCMGTGGSPIPGYSYPSSGTSGVFKLDSITGTLAWCDPQLQGDYAIAIKIKEWRKNDDGNYVLVGYVIRDMLISVTTCSADDLININIPTDTCVLVNTNYTVNINASTVNSNTIILIANGTSFHSQTPVSIVTSTQTPGVTSTTFTWPTQYSNLRNLPYQVLINSTTNDICSGNSNYAVFNIKLLPHPPQNLTATSSTNFIFLRWDKPINYGLTGTNPFLRYKIYRKTGLSTWNHSNCETTPPAYTGFTCIGVTSSNISDTSFFDYNGWNPFPAGQDYTYLVLAEYMDGATSYVSNMASNQIYVGLKENMLANTDITISPNPTNENLNIFFSQATDELFTIELFDITGRKIKTFFNKESLTKQNTFQLKLENLNQGIYFLRIMGDEKTNITKKIIKQ